MPGNPILLVTDAGHGETPACPEAKFAVNDLVTVAGNPLIPPAPTPAVVVSVVPPGFPPEYALADAAGQARPLQISKPLGHITYILGVEGDRRPHLVHEHQLAATGERCDPENIQWTRSTDHG